MNNVARMLYFIFKTSNFNFLYFRRDLYDTPIRSLENLKSVRGFLYLDSTPIESLGNLTSVGGDLDLSFTSLSEKHTEEEIRQMVDVGGEIYLLIYWNIGRVKHSISYEEVFIIKIFLWKEL